MQWLSFFPFEYSLRHDRRGLVALVVIWLSILFSVSSEASTSEIVFRVGENATIDWFQITDPTIRGTIAVINAPYAANSILNSAAVDISRNRLIFDAQGATPQGYAINLAGLQLVKNAATPVTVASLGAWDTTNVADAGYSKATGNVYYHTDKSASLRYLNFDANGLITGHTTVGNLGLGTPSSITAGDLDFDASGTLWASGTDETNTQRLWNFDATTLATKASISTNGLYNGITFNAAGNTLYGYTLSSDSYGIINQTTGAFQSVLTTNTAEFGVIGDLATGTFVTVVPEGATLLPIAVLAVAAVTARRKRTALSSVVPYP